MKQVPEENNKTVAAIKRKNKGVLISQVGQIVKCLEIVGKLGVEEMTSTSGFASDSVI